MSVSKRLRFEVLRRDNHSCRYCGATAPDAVLTVDHVLAVTLGGTDEPANLVTACRACNSGKSSVPADAAIVADVSVQTLRWARAAALAAEERRRDHIAEHDYVTSFWGYWGDSWLSDYDEVPPSEPGDDDAIRVWYSRGLDLLDLYKAVQTTVAKYRRGRLRWDESFRYLAGCAWGMLRDLEARTRQLIDEGAV